MGRNHTLGTILVVDDDRAIREALEEVLLSAGYRVSTAKNGQDALERLLTDDSAGPDPPRPDDAGDGRLAVQRCPEAQPHARRYPGDHHFRRRSAVREFLGRRGVVRAAPLDGEQAFTSCACVWGPRVCLPIPLPAPRLRRPSWCVRREE